MPAVSLCQTLRGFLGRYGKSLIRKLPCAFMYYQYKSFLTRGLMQPPGVSGKPAAFCCWCREWGARLVPAASVWPVRASPPPPRTGPAAVFWGLQAIHPGESVLHPTLKMLTRSFTSNLCQTDHEAGETCIQWNNERSRWTTWAAVRCDALQVQMILDKGLEQNSDLNRTNAANCTPSYFYLQFLLLLVKKSQAEIGLYCIRYCMT